MKKEVPFISAISVSLSRPKTEDRFLLKNAISAGTGSIAYRSQRSNDFSGILPSEGPDKDAIEQAAMKDAGSIKRESAVPGNFGSARKGRNFRKKECTGVFFPRAISKARMNITREK